MAIRQKKGVMLFNIKLKMEEKVQNVYKYIMIIATTILITFLVTSIAVSNYYIGGKNDNVIILDSKKQNSNVQTSLEAIDAIIEKYYLGEKNEKDLIEGAIKGYVEGLGDPYSQYITAEEMAEYEIQLMGNYVGIGVYITSSEEHNLIQIISPIAESPAAEAGILPGDFIKSIDGVEYVASDLEIASEKIKGEEGSTIKLVIIRENKEIEFELKRRKVLTNPVKEEVLEGNIGYLGVSSFDEGTANHFKEKYKDLQKNNIKGLIIDLRNNGGGILSEALEIIECIASKGDTLLITVNNQEKEDITQSENNPIIKVPVVVLINENSASASEIVAGALKDLKKATIVGMKSYGKGVIQRIIKLTNGSALKLTIEEYFTPNKNKINKIGVEPHEKVELPENVKNPLLLERKDDTQLDRAIEILKNK